MRTVICHGQALGSRVSSRQKQPLKMSPGRDVRLKLSVKKTHLLLKKTVLRIDYVDLCPQRRLIADAVGISTGSVKTILREHLLMRKVCARWVPRMLDQKMKDCRCELLSSENLKLMQLDCNLFLKRIVTGDETWIHHYALVRRRSR